MTLRLRFIAFLTLLAALVGLSTACREDQKPRVLLVSIDGFRWDYRDRFDTPTLDAIAAAGVSAVRLQPVFPSKTFPNHFTLVTGLVPDRHGIISNTMRDPRMPGVEFSLGNREAVTDPRWWEAEPIWVTLEKAGRRTAPYLWPGSEAPIAGVRPTHFTTYSDDLTDAERLKLIDGLFAKAESEWPDFLTMYWPHVDSAGHSRGPDSVQVKEAVERIDGALGQLQRLLDARGVANLNVIVVSDHGMSHIVPERRIFLDDYLDLDTVEIWDSLPNIAIAPRTRSVEDVYARLAGKHPHLKVYRQGDYPARLQFGAHPRVPPIYAMADDGWGLFPRRADAGRGRPGGGGAHGYDNAADSMQGLFVAAGPAFKRGFTVERLRSVDLYELMCAILGVTPKPNDGNRQAARALLR